MTEQISSFFIRPPRQTYFDHDLGPQIFPLATKIGCKSKMGTRKDFSILNNRNFKISASFYQVQGSNSNQCLIYLHTHHGSRLQATCLIEPMLNANINLCLFDFSGYGNSEGDIVTLGIQQSHDIKCVMDFLMKNCYQQKFISWGRSMGAVASLIYLSKLQKYECNPIVGAIFDSPFHSLSELTVEIGSKNIGIPQAFLRPFIFLIKKSLQNRLNFQQLQLEPIASKINIPCIFITSKQDKFVSYTHSQKLYRKYGGPKQLIYIEKDHNQPRKQEDLSQIFSFIWKKFNVNLKTEKQEDNLQRVISAHLNFIHKYQTNFSEEIDYFERNRQAPVQPLTERIQYPVSFHKQNFSMRPSPQKKISSASIKYFKNSNKFENKKLNQMKI